MNRHYLTVAIGRDGHAIAEVRTGDMQEAHAAFHRLIGMHREDPAVVMIAAYSGDDPVPFSVCSFER